LAGRVGHDATTPLHAEIVEDDSCGGHGKTKQAAVFDYDRFKSYGMNNRGMIPGRGRE
jgi:hypothetical protein